MFIINSNLELINLPCAETILHLTKSVLFATRIVDLVFASLFFANSFKINLASSNESLFNEKINKRINYFKAYQKINFIYLMIKNKKIKITMTLKKAKIC